jgi:hypothetical protein
MKQTTLSLRPSPATAPHTPVVVSNSEMPNTTRTPRKKTGNFMDDILVEPLGNDAIVLSQTSDASTRPSSSHVQ